MIVSIIGSHGVGKTTTISCIKNKRSEWIYIYEATRVIIPRLGYNDPYKFVDDFGIAFYESIIISQWSILKHIANIHSENVVLLDRSPIDNLAYYYLHRKGYEEKYEQILVRLAKYYLEFIEQFVYIPSGMFNFVPDKMQRADTQLELDRILLGLLQRFNIDYYTLDGIEIEDRANEIIRFIDTNKGR